MAKRPAEKTAVCIGVFDGVHRGHTAILDECCSIARRSAGRWMVITFDRHPLETLAPERAPLLLASRAQSVEAIQARRPDRIVVLPFTERRASQDAEVFLRWALRELAMTDIVIGASFSVGRSGKGDRPWLLKQSRALGFAVHETSAIHEGGRAISSSLLRETIARGNLGTATRMFGHDIPELAGPVIPGRKLGRSLGAPTLNIAIPPGRVLPPDGVYAVEVRMGDTPERWAAVANLGVKPTLGGTDRTLEAHLFDTSGDFYGKTAALTWHAMIRPEQCFESLEALSQQIALDISIARKMLKISGSGTPEGGAAVDNHGCAVYTPGKPMRETSML